jgi:hypothetical protein
MKPERRPFQFSLRKALLWTAVWSVYLGIVRWVGIWLAFSVEIWLAFSVGLTIYLAALFAVRIKWGYERGLEIVRSAAGLLVVPCVVVLLLGLLLGALLSPVNILIDLVMVVFALGALGIFFGVPGLTCVHFVMRAVDWLDNLMATKPPQDPG